MSSNTTTGTAAPIVKKKKSSKKSSANKPLMSHVKPGELVDKGFAFELKIKSLNAEIKTLEKERDKIRITLDLFCETQGVNTLGGSHGVYTRTDKTIPIVANYEDFTAYIRETGQFELLQKRLGGELNKIIDRGDTLPPGITTMTVIQKKFKKIK